MRDSDFTRAALADSPLVQHLFNKLKSEVTAAIENEKIQGRLVSIDLPRKHIEVVSEGQVYFINLRNIRYIKASEIYIRVKDRGPSAYADHAVEG